MNRLDQIVSDALSAEVADVEPPADGVDRLRTAVQRRDRRRVVVALAAAVTVVVGGLAAAAVMREDGGDPVITDTSTPTSERPPSGPSSTSSTTTSTTLPTTTTTAAPTPGSPEDERLAESFLRFAAAPGPDTMANLPLADEVALGLGSHIYTVRARDELVEPGAWQIDVEDFAFGRVGPLSALDTTTQAGGTSNVVVSVGDHPHCASPPLPAPGELNRLRHISIQPDPAEPVPCLDWWAVDLFVTHDGEIAGVTLALWEP